MHFARAAQLSATSECISTTGQLEASSQ